MRAAAVLAQRAVPAAPRLLGWELSRHDAEGLVRVRLTEVEAYEGQDDPGSHAYRGPTARTTIMFGGAGRAYVYRSYGVHWACNVVTGPAGVASAVLLRAGEVVEGHALAQHRRGAHVAHRALARGPGNLAAALGITGADYGAALLDGGALRLHPASHDGTVVAGPRVGVSRAADVPWRFWLADEPSVSAYRRSPRAAPAGN